MNHDESSTSNLAIGDAGGMAFLAPVVWQEMSSSGDLDRMKSLSSAGHHGGVRVFHDTVEIARDLTTGIQGCAK